MVANEHTFMILAYLDSPYLDECIDSIKKQSIPSNFFICTSTPSLYIGEIAKKHGSKILINHDKKNCIASDWTFAYNKCRTKYLTLAHQDDIYTPTYTEKCLKIAEKFPDHLLLFSDYMEKRNTRIRTLTKYLLLKRTFVHFFYLCKKNLHKPFFKRLFLSFGNPIACPSVIYNKKNIGALKFNADFKYVLDWDIWERLANRKGDFLFVKEKLLIHRIHQESSLIKGNIKGERYIEDEIMFRKFWPRSISKFFVKLYSKFLY